MCQFLKDVAVPIATTVGGFISGIVSGIILEKWRRQRRTGDDFRFAVQAVIQGLGERPDNLDDAFVNWYAHSVRVLSAHANYFIACEPKWWANVEDAWNEYAMPEKKKDVATFLVGKISREELLRRLHKLLKTIQDAG